METTSTHMETTTLIAPDIYDADTASLRAALRALNDFLASAHTAPEIELARVRRQHSLITLELEERSANAAIIAPLGSQPPPTGCNTGGCVARLHGFSIL